MVDKNKLNRIKGILSAKQGAEIPKFQNPSGPLQRQFYTMWDPNSQSHKFYLDGQEVTEQQFFNDKRVRKDFKSTYSPDNKGVKANPTSINTPSTTTASTPSQYQVDGIPMSKERYLANANFSPNTMYWDRVSGNTVPSDVQLETPYSAAIGNPAPQGSMYNARVGAQYIPPTPAEPVDTTPTSPPAHYDPRTTAYEMNRGPQGSMVKARVGSTMAIPGDPGIDPNTAVEHSAAVNAMAMDPRLEARAKYEAVAAIHEKYKPESISGLLTPQDALNADLKTRALADVKAAQVTGLSAESEKNIQNTASAYMKKIEAEKAKTLNNQNTAGMVAQLGTQAFTAIGDAFGAAQAATDSDLTKGITAGYKGVQSAVSSMGPIGQVAGSIMGIASATGDILQSLGGGTDQQTTLDKWMDSPLLSWNVGAVNGFLGKKADSFSVDQDIAANVGSSYGGTMDDLEDAAEKSGKKYGLFSSKARKKANAAIADAKSKQNLMGDISDTAPDQRLAFSSMGEQAGLSYSLMTGGGYDQKYTYAAKHGGLLEWNPVLTLEWEPQIELNWELPEFKEGGSIDLVEELEWIPELKEGGTFKDVDIPETEETTQKNVIPEGALHKNKHHMEHADGLTKKGIPVIDEEGEQQAEIEHSEIIFTLEVTKKLEEYYEIFYSENSSNKEKEQAALDAGKLLVYQILENTEDRTGLIESCKKGGSLTLKKSTDDLIEEVLDWMPTLMVVEEVIEEVKEEEKPKKKSEKEQMKEAIKEVLIELLTK